MLQNIKIKRFEEFYSDGRKEYKTPITFIAYFITLHTFVIRMRTNNTIVYTLLYIIANMAQHNEFGQVSEDRAVAYLMARGYTIRERNWRLGHKEIDIIAQKNGTIAIIEVKARKSDRYGDPTEAITDSKIKNLVTAASAYVRYHRIDLPVRFDVIIIIGEPGNQSVEHIEDAFYPPLY